jgi:uncharacterized membrane protein YqhA
VGETGPAAPPERPDGARRLETWFEWGLQRSRLIILVPVVVLLLASAAAFVYDAGLFIWSLVQVVEHPFPAGHRIGLFLLVIDLFLVGATMFIAAIGFYELFISRVDGNGTSSTLPTWLVMRDLNDLKARVVSMLVLVTAASFVDQVVDFGGGSDILFLGGAVALVIFALTAFLRFGTGRDGA